MDILAKFYNKGGASFEQMDVQASEAPREIAPETFGKYEKKGGKGIVQMIGATRDEFTQGKKDLEAAEAQAQADYDAAKAAYYEARRALVEAHDRLTVELQTAESTLEQATDDKAANEAEVASATAYLGQLAKSCDSLLQHYDDRVRLRNEEKAAINEAI